MEESDSAVVKVGDESMRESIGEPLDVGLAESTSALAWSAYKATRGAGGNGLKCSEGLRN